MAKKKKHIGWQSLPEPKLKKGDIVFLQSVPMRCTGRYKSSTRISSGSKTYKIRK